MGCAKQSAKVSPHSHNTRPKTVNIYGALKRQRRSCPSKTEFRVLPWPCLLCETTTSSAHRLSHRHISAAFKACAAPRELQQIYQLHRLRRLSAPEGTRRLRSPTAHCCQTLPRSSPCSPSFLRTCSILSPTSSQHSCAAEHILY
jgi:hypothetical protein